MNFSIYNIIKEYFLDCYSNSTRVRDKIYLSLKLIIFCFAFSIIFLLYNWSLDSNFYSLSFSFFAIFMPLLLTFQGGIFSLFQRKWKIESDNQEEKIKERNMLIKCINLHITYTNFIALIICILSIVMYIISSQKNYNDDYKIFDFIYLVFYSHFIVCFWLILRRNHILFNEEYNYD